MLGLHLLHGAALWGSHLLLGSKHGVALLGLHLLHGAALWGSHLLLGHGWSGSHGLLSQSHSLIHLVGLAGLLKSLNRLLIPLRLLLRGIVCWAGSIRGWEIHGVLLLV